MSKEDLGFQGFPVAISPPGLRVHGLSHILVIRTYHYAIAGSTNSMGKLDLSRLQPGAFEMT